MLLGRKSPAAAPHWKDKCTWLVITLNRVIRSSTSVLSYDRLMMSSVMSSNIALPHYGDTLRHTLQPWVQYWVILNMFARWVRYLRLVDNQSKTGNWEAWHRVAIRPSFSTVCLSLSTFFCSVSLFHLFNYFRLQRPGIRDKKFELCKMSKKIAGLRPTPCPYGPALLPRWALTI